MPAVPHDCAEPYFERVDTHRFRPTRHVGGGWNPDEQHIAPAFGLLAHAVETDRDARRNDGLRLGRVSCDILGVIPMEAVDIEIDILRAGRTIELVEAHMRHDGRTAVILRAWLMAGGDTAAIAGSGLSTIAPVTQMAPWDIGTRWPGGFVRSVEIRRDEQAAGNARFWVRSPHPLVGGETTSATARMLGLLDVANGVTPRAEPEAVAYPNLDLTAHLFEVPRGEWIGFDTRVSFGSDGIGLTHSVLHDSEGPIGTSSQCLTVRPRPR